jgi:hypothetical protein
MISKYFLNLYLFHIVYVFLFLSFYAADIQGLYIV